MPNAPNPLIPAPIPSAARPPVISSKLAIAEAVRAGWRMYGSVTQVRQMEIAGFPSQETQGHPDITTKPLIRDPQMIEDINGIEPLRPIENDARRLAACNPEAKPDLRPHRVKRA